MELGQGNENKGLMLAKYHKNGHVYSGNYNC
jgi:hypothetical protein